MDYKLTHRKIVKFVVFTILFCTYILPTGLISKNNDYKLPKFIFMGVTFFLYIITFKKINYKELIFIIAMLLITVLKQNINYLMFFTIIFLDKLINYKEYIVDYLKKSSILYVCLFFTLIYSVIFILEGSREGRYAFTAIKEINQSGLAIFCLAMLLNTKNKKIAFFTAIFGILTISRSYLLALICVIFFNLKIIQKFCTDSIIKVLNYTNITMVTNLILVGLGFFYLYQYKIGNIFWGDDVSDRLYTLLDYSNFFRFVCILILLLCFKKNIFKLFTGMTDKEYLINGKIISQELNIPYKYTPPHNLFFSHLKIYGLFVILEIIFTSSVLNKVVNKKNFGIYIALVLYSIILGAGFYSYWLYLSIFTLVIGGNDNEDNSINSI